MAWLQSSDAMAKLPDLILRGRFEFDFDGIPFCAKNLSLRKKMNLMKAGLDMVVRRDQQFAFPPIIQIEPTNICNLKCPLCPSGLETLKRPRGFMTAALFQRILDELADTLTLIYLYGWGEPFLNKEMVSMIASCTERNILSLTSTNGQMIQTVEEAMDVVEAGLTALIIAMDGSTQEIYQSYRKGGDVDKVKLCAENIEEAKLRLGTDLPYTNLRAVVTRENQEDLMNLERFARHVGVNMFSYKSVGILTSSEHYQEYEPHNGELRRFKYEDTNRQSKPLIQCPYPFRQPTIFWDGTLVGCEFDYDRERPWGKIGEQTFSEIWKNREALKLRRSIKTGLDRPPFCHRCPYQDRMKDSCVLSCKEIKPLLV